MPQSHRRQRASSTARYANNMIRWVCYPAFSLRTTMPGCRRDGQSTWCHRMHLAGHPGERQNRYPAAKRGMAGDLTLAKVAWVGRPSRGETQQSALPDPSSSWRAETSTSLKTGSQCTATCFSPVNPSRSSSPPPFRGRSPGRFTRRPDRRRLTSAQIMTQAFRRQPTKRVWGGTPSSCSVHATEKACFPPCNLRRICLLGFTRIPPETYMRGSVSRLRSIEPAVWRHSPARPMGRMRCGRLGQRHPG